MNDDRSRGVFVNRTLNMRSIAAIGYDLDYTLVHYNTAEWEGAAYAYARQWLAEQGWPVAALEFRPDHVIQGLTIDLELGNLVKATRFGYVIRAAHGTRMLDFDELRSTYSGVVVELSNPRFVFLNTLFSQSEATLFSQAVDLVDQRLFPGSLGYDQVYRKVQQAHSAAHQDGAVKEGVIADPARFLEADPLVVETLQHQRQAGKRLMLITNSDWAYAAQIMELAFDPYIEDGGWRDLFDTVIVSANKPGFFTGNDQLFQVVDETAATLRPHFGPIEAGGVFYGGSAVRVEESLGLSGDEILYVGDHLFGDVHVSKDMFRWRTALVLREMEAELAAVDGFAEDQRRLVELMDQKEQVEGALAESRMERLLRRDEGDSLDDVEAGMREHFAALAHLDERITPLAIASGTLSNERWGLLMRSGIDKSLFARQVERYADVYTSRVSNFEAVTPYGLLRASQIPLPHDLGGR